MSTEASIDSLADMIIAVFLPNDPSKAADNSMDEAAIA
jgi:hypothetical protein